MNILYLHCHDAGRILSPYGFDAPAPHLEALCRTATLFRQAHCAGPTCSPSRAALLTGLPAHQTGMFGLVHRGFRLGDARQHLAYRLRSLGYTTMLAGVQHELTTAQIAEAYDHCFPAAAGHAPGVSDLEIAARAAEFLRRPHSAPFFLSCGFFFPHRDFPDADPMIDPAALVLPPGLTDEPRVRRDYARYGTAVRIMDQAAGVVLRALDETGLAHDTLVIFTTDHGIAFPGMKCYLTDAGTGVALLIRPPDFARVRRETSALVSHLDVAPTIFDYLGLEAPAEWSGRSLRALIEGRTDRHHEAVYSEINYHCAYEPARCVRTERYTLICYFTEDGYPRPSNTDDSPAKAVWLESGALQSSRASVQLYDRAADAHERNNVADKEDYAAVRRDLEARLAAWMRATDDPLLRGPMPRPAGACVNTAASLSAAAGPFER